ncbi:putative membrane protein [Mycobacteroides abscessus MAB_030201_1075]|uniref:Putative membrane protein n=1 Tax=Mycobacteroides abscessus MAB_030201_1075 TaxID=1335410 RepID=A0A829PJV5_9MYCO|nr:putative membrane protein [Mycobacteroides abscessus MAB_030201_1075]
MAAAVTAPLAAPGYLLIRDAVSTPRSYVTDAALGVGEAAPRAVPQDFFIAVMTVLVDGGVLVKMLLALGLWLAGWGAARLAAQLVPAAGIPGELVAATIAIWNPYVAERLLQGHWSLLVGYGCLPWIALTVIRLRTATNLGAWCPLAFWIAVAGLTPTGTVLALIVGLAAATDRRSRVGVLAISVLAAMPWLVASGLGAAVPAGDAAGSTRSRHGPSRDWAPSAVWPHWAACGTRRRCPPHARPCSRWCSRWCCLSWSRSARRYCGARARLSDCWA